MPSLDKPKEGRHSTARRPRRRPKMNPLQRYQRGRVIAEMRARPRPVAWKDIAKQIGMSMAGAQEAYAQFLEWEMPLHDPLAVVDETIDAMTVALHESIQTYEDADPGSSVRVQALRTAVDTALTRLQVMRAAGRAPRSLAAPAVGQQMQTVFREFAELLRRHQVGDDVIRDFLELAEGQMGRMTAIDGRELPSAA